jgi:Peptidoglycan-binding protein, CsiV
LKLKTCLNALFSLLVLLFVSPAHAAWYQVEVIVFDYLSPSSNGELWYENPGLPDRSNSIELIAELADEEEETGDPVIVVNETQEIPQSKAELIPYLQLTEDMLRLDGVQRILKLSREYRPLLHVAWQQPGLTPSNARAVHLQKFEEAEELTTEEFLAEEPDDITALRDEAELSEDVYQVLDLIFDGTIRLRSSRFLHVDVDIAHFPSFLSNEDISDKEEGSLFVQQQADYVRLQESRKIKLNEIHYFDHPVFGVLLRVSRLKVN